MKADDLLSTESFKMVTEWKLDGERIRLATLEWAESGGWLYAFVVDDAVIRYVGLTSGVLRSRMDSYRDGKVDQNLRLRTLITEHLANGHRVSIYGRHEKDAEKRVAEERRLISKWAPGWNLERFD